jgi:hypothetical protein
MIVVVKAIKLPHTEKEPAKTAEQWAIIENSALKDPGK